MSGWDEYLTAARRLDTVRREAALAPAAEAEPGGPEDGRVELAAVRRRLDLQRDRLAAAAQRAGIAGLGVDAPQTGAGSDEPEELRPGGADALHAAGSVDAVRALQVAVAGLDAADEILSDLDRVPPVQTSRPGRATARNAAVYATFAAAVLALQVMLFLHVRPAASSILATAGGAFLPLAGFGLSWLVTGLAFGGRQARRYPFRTGADRSPLLGAAISLAPVIALCCWFAVAAMLH